MSDALALVRQLAAERGLDLVAVTDAGPHGEALDHLVRWCAEGRAAGMGYMSRHPPERADPRTLLEGVATVLSFAVNYHTPAPPFAAEGRYGRVARYAWGVDYHDVLLARLRSLAAALERGLGGRARAAVDHSPILERAFAARAGLGFFGKNTCLLLPGRGSWYLLGEILTQARIPAPRPGPPDHCGTCTRCLPACPTGALPAPFVLDARVCISYLTIEHRGPIEAAVRPRLGAWVFGCDVCQDVCPFNRHAVPTAWEELRPGRGVGPRLDLAEVLGLGDEAAFRARFAGTPLLRPRRAGLLRNAAVAARNVGAVGCVPALAAATRDPEGLVRGHALWALAGLAPERAGPLAERARRRDPDAFVRAEAEAVLRGAPA